MFNAAIINLFTGGQVIGRSVDYRDINDGIRAMERLSIELTSTTEEITQGQQEAKRDAYWDEVVANATRNYSIFFGYVQFGEGMFGGVGGYGGYFSPFKFTSIGIELKLGYLSTGKAPSYGGGYGSGSVAVGLVYPFTKEAQIFADFIVEMGYFGGLSGAFASWVTPCFDVGFSYFDYYGISIKYRGTWYDGYYIHSVGIGLIVDFNK
jgi:hypothetical protein